MAIRDIFKVKRKTFINPTGWIGLESILQQNRILWRFIKGLFAARQPTREESFEQAMKRLGLTEAELEPKASFYQKVAWMFLALAILSFLYAFFLLFRYGTLTGWLLAIAVTGLLGSQAFQYDFWAFQIRRRKLGATYAEWKQHIFSDTDNRG